jgi:hypothetical protein
VVQNDVQLLFAVRADRARPNFACVSAAPPQARSPPSDPAQERVQLCLLERAKAVCSASSRFDVVLFVPGKDPFQIFFFSSEPAMETPAGQLSICLLLLLLLRDVSPILSCFELPPDPSATGDCAGLYECSASISVSLACSAWLDLQASTRLFIAKPWSPLTLCYMT